LNERQPPDFVVVGHVCQDILPDGDLGLGGSVSYAATTAYRLGYRVGVVTTAGPDLDVAQALPGIEVVCHRSAATTVFENIYLNGSRRQILHQRAEVITCDHIPMRWRSAPMVYLGSIDQEIDPSVFHCFADEALIGVMPQGFFRRWDEQGVISFTEWTPEEDLLRRVDLLVISELDVPNPEDLARKWGQFARIIAITRAERGATVYESSSSCHYPARPAQQVDPTGAGDVFSAAFLIRLAETGDPSEAARFANVVASFSVEGPGVAGIPPRRQVEAFLDAAAGRPTAPG
jgi:sugar/nucleoside kinase (ribokinase family)